MISLILVALIADAPTRSIEWINTPEAYFATAKEREEWFRLADDELREAFRRRYWLMRDPTQATERNEFREIILDRIMKADQRFPFTGGLRGSETAQGLVFIVLGGLDAPLPDRIRTILREAQPVARFGDVTITAGDLWTGTGSTAIIKAAVANAGDRTTHLTIYGELHSGDRIVTAISEPFMTCEALDAAPGTKTCLLRLDVPPGAYDASIAVLDDRTGEKLMAISTPLRVFDPSSDFALLNRAERRTHWRGRQPLHSCRRHSPSARRRAILDRESLWFFATLRSAAGASAITADLQLRRNGKPVAAHSFAPNLTEIAPSVFRLGQELPLGQFVPGDYTLYLTVRRDGAAPEVRRADFRIVP